MDVLSSPVGKLFATRTRTAALVAVVVAAVSVAYASIPDSNGVIHGCYDKNNGQLRVIDPAVSSCNPSETPLQWSQTGPQGPMGPQGPAGSAGPSRSTRSRRSVGLDCVWGFQRSRWWKRGSSRCSGNCREASAPARQVRDLRQNNHRLLRSRLRCGTRDMQTDR